MPTISVGGEATCPYRKVIQVEQQFLRQSAPGSLEKIFHTDNAAAIELS
jgi:hypothetical protein